MSVTHGLAFIAETITVPLIEVRQLYQDNICTMNSFKFLCIHAALLCSVIVPGVCKGDDGASGTMPGPASGPEPNSSQQADRYPGIDWPLSPGQIRSFFIGSALNLGPDEIERIIRDLLGSASTILLSDALEFSYLGTGGSRYQTTCEGDSCETTVDSGVEITTLEELLESELTETQSLMTYQNVSLVQGRSRDIEDGIVLETLAYGGWQDYHFFSVEAVFHPDVDNFDQILSGSFSIGDATNVNPVSGSGTWRGVMVGTESYYKGEDDHSVHRFLQGDAELNLILDYSDLEAEISFTNIRYLDNGDLLDDIGWVQVDLEDGRFRGGVSVRGAGWVDGYFYGPDHEEAGGIFEKDYIVGAFGLERVPGPSVFPRFPDITNSWPFRTAVYLPGYAVDWEAFEEEHNLDLTQTEIREIYNELNDQTESSGFDDYLPFINEADLESVMAYGGISFAQGRYGEEGTDGGSLLGYGGWLEYNFFGVEVDYLDGGSSDVIPKTYSVGYETGSNPGPEGGSGTWEGVMIGYREEAPFPREVKPQVVGTATITIAEFVNPLVDVSLSHEFTVTWEDIPLTDGSFGRTDDLGEIEGRFYGPNHEEVGGTFWYEDLRTRYRDEIDKVYGAFGAYRLD